MGASHVVMADLHDHQRDRALMLGATGFALSGPALSENLADLCGGAPDIVFECVGKRGLLQAACQAVAPKLGISWHTARQWVQQARRDGVITRVEGDVIAENARLRRENQELRDTNELLKAASAFFASELDPQRRR